MGMRSLKLTRSMGNGYRNLKTGPALHCSRYLTKEVLTALIDYRTERKNEAVL